MLSIFLVSSSPLRRLNLGVDAVEDRLDSGTCCALAPSCGPSLGRTLRAIASRRWPSAPAPGSGLGAAIGVADAVLFAIPGEW